MLKVILFLLLNAVAHSDPISLQPCFDLRPKQKQSVEKAIRQLRLDIHLTEKSTSHVCKLKERSSVLFVLDSERIYIHKKHLNPITLHNIMLHRIAQLFIKYTSIEKGILDYVPTVFDNYNIWLSENDIYLLKYH